MERDSSSSHPLAIARLYQLYPPSMTSTWAILLRCSSMHPLLSPRESSIKSQSKEISLRSIKVLLQVTTWTRSHQSRLRPTSPQPLNWGPTHASWTNKTGPQSTRVHSSIKTARDPPARTPMKDHLLPMEETQARQKASCPWSPILHPSSRITCSGQQGCSRRMEAELLAPCLQSQSMSRTLGVS